MGDESRSGNPGRQVERLLAAGREHSLRDVAGQSGLHVDYILRNHTAMGLPRPTTADEPIYDDAILANAEILATLLDAGLAESDLIGLGRVMGATARRMAEALVDVFAAGQRDSPTEDDSAQNLMAIVEAALPDLGRMSAAVLRLHLLDVVQREIVDREDPPPASTVRDVAVAFVDLTGFTAYGDSRSIESVSRLAGRFETLLVEIALPPVRLIKVLGDGALLIAERAPELVRAILALASDAAAANLPPLHAGLAYGPAQRSLGDWYGRTVNLAARICDAADSDELLASAEAVAAARADATWRPAGQVRLDGISDAVSLYRAGLR